MDCINFRNLPHLRLSDVIVLDYIVDGQQITTLEEGEMVSLNFSKKLKYIKNDLQVIRRKNNWHLLTVPEGRPETRDARLSMFREAKPRVNKTYCFLRAQSISILLYTKSQRNDKLKRTTYENTLNILFLELVTLNLIWNPTMSILSKGRVFTWFFSLFTGE